jgi:hypothetical protein
MLIPVPYARGVHGLGMVGDVAMPCIRVVLIGPTDRLTTWALVDSGCVQNSVIHPTVAAQLGLETTGEPVGRLQQNSSGSTVAYDVFQPGQTVTCGFDMFTVTLRPTVSEWARQPVNVILGEDFFEQVTVAFDQPGRTMWFGMPGLGEPVPAYEEMIACRDR